MKYLKICIICFFASVFVIFTSCPRYDYIPYYKWKQTSGDCEVGNGWFHFEKGSSYTYQWPIVKRYGKPLCIVLLCFGTDMMVYSLECKEICYFQIK